MKNKKWKQMITITQLSNTSPGIVHEAREEAFRGYETTWTRHQYEKLLQRRGYIPELSFGAFYGGRLVSFTLNCLGSYNGVTTAYDAGTGTIEEYRGLGIAARIFNEALPFLKSAGVAQYILEVLQHNTTAASLYKSLGFSITREFNYFVGNMAGMQENIKGLPPEIELRDADLSQQDEMIQMWDCSPSWQNSFESINRTIVDFKIIGAFHYNMLVGYGITEPASGDITQLGVKPAYRRRGIGSCIFKKLLAYNKYSSAKVINTEKQLDHITRFVENNGIFTQGSQFEMTLKL